VDLASERLPARLEDAGFDDAMQAALENEPTLAADETPVNLTDPHAGLAEEDTGAPHVLVIRTPHRGLTWLRALGSRQHAAITAVLAFFTGFLISDGYGACQDLLPKLAGVQQCCQHVIRRCRAVTKLGPGGLQSWAADVIEILREAHQAVEDALARGDPVLDEQLLAKLRARYDEAAAFGITHNRLRDWHEGNHPGYTLGCWLRDYKEQVWLFTREFCVEWTKQLLRAGHQGRQTAPGRLRVLAHPAHPRPLVPHSQLPRLRREPRTHRARRHHPCPRRKPVASGSGSLKPQLIPTPEWTPSRRDGYTPIPRRTPFPS
jgi:hypothetical protein